jgi:hypothetical protein
LAAILSHEMAHIRRYDLIINLMQRIVEALLFFHPVTWWISRRIRIERENCCDDLAAAGCGRLTYAGSLLRMAELCAGIRGLKIAPQLESLAADGGEGSQLGYRIRRLLGEVDSPRVSVTRNAQTDQKPQETDRPEVEASETPEDEPNKKASSKSEAKTRIEGIVLDSEKQSIAGVPLSILAFDGDEENAFKPIYLDADNEGRFSVEIPSRTFRAHFGSPNDQYDSLEGFWVRDGQAVVPWDGIEAKPTGGKISVVATLLRTYQLRFDVINADSGQRVSDVAILYKEDKATWNGE